MAFPFSTPSPARVIQQPDAIGRSGRMRIARKPQGPSERKSIAARMRQRRPRALTAAPAINPGLAPTPPGLPGLSPGLPR